LSYIDAFWILGWRRLLCSFFRPYLERITLVANELARLHISLRPLAMIGAEFGHFINPS